MIHALRTRSTDVRKRWLILLSAALVAACAGNSTTHSTSEGAWPTPADVAVAKTGFSVEGLARLVVRVE